MKKLILILIIIPSIGNSQIKSFDDIKNLNSISSLRTQPNIYFKSKKFTFFNALNDGVDQTFGTFFYY